MILKKENTCCRTGFVPQDKKVPRGHDQTKTGQPDL